VLLQPTTPARRPEDLSAAIELLDSDPGADGVVACSEPSWNPFHVGVVEKDGLLRPAFPAAHEVTRRQDAPRFLRVNGAFYVCRRRWLDRSDAHWLDAPHRVVVIPDRDAIDVDCAEDFERLEWLLASGKVTLPWLEERK
jgi:N-acylneuraminate cytidylyltransferase